MYTIQRYYYTCSLTLMPCRFEFLVCRYNAKNHIGPTQLKPIIILLQAVEYRSFFPLRVIKVFPTDVSYSFSIDNVSAWQVCFYHPYISISKKKDKQGAVYMDFGHLIPHWRSWEVMVTHYLWHCTVRNASVGQL